MSTRPPRFVAAALATSLAATLLLSGCSAAAPAPLTTAEENEMCLALGDSVTWNAATAVYSDIFLYRSYLPSMPHGDSLPHADCAYLARSQYSDRLEVFYFAPTPELGKELDAQLFNTGYLLEGNRWVIHDFLGALQVSARIEQFYGPSDATPEFRRYAALIGRPALVVTFTSRRY